MRGHTLSNIAVATPRASSLERRWTTLRKPAGWAIGILALYLAGRDADWAAIRQGLEGLDVLMTVAAILLAVLVVYTKAVRWSVLVRSAVVAMDQKVAEPNRLDGLSLTPVVFVGQLVNNGLPLRVGELVRIEALAARGVSRLAGASTVIVEKLCDGVALVLFTTILSLVVPLPHWLNRNGILVGIAGAVVLVVGAFTIRPLLRLIARRTDRVGRVFGAVTTSLVALRVPAVATHVAAWTIASWIIGLLVNYAALRACGITASAGMVLLVTVGGYLGGLLPAPPGRFGVFQAVSIAAVEAFGVKATPAFVFAIVLYVAVVLVPGALGGVSLLWALVDRNDSKPFEGSPT